VSAQEQSKSRCREGLQGLSALIEVARSPFTDRGGQAAGASTVDRTGNTPAGEEPLSELYLRTLTGTDENTGRSPGCSARSMSASAYSGPAGPCRSILKVFAAPIPAFGTFSERRRSDPFVDGQGVASRHFSSGSFGFTEVRGLRDQWYIVTEAKPTKEQAGRASDF
jgi:hypothetical protein